MTINSKPNDKAFIGYSFPFLFLGLFIFIIVQGFFIVSLPKLIEGDLQTPILLAEVHLFILGFATMIAMGAMIQLVPVALQTQIKSKKLIVLHFVFYIVGMSGLIWSFNRFQLHALIGFGALTLIGLLLFEMNLLPAVLKACSSTIKWGIFSALIYLFLTVSLGIMMIGDFLHPFMGSYHDKLFAIHVAFGLIGWFTLLIMSFSYKLVPMFALSHQYESKWARLSIIFVNGGLIGVALGIFFSQSAISVVGGVLILFGFFSYFKQIQRILQKRLRKKLDIGVKSALVAGPFTIFILLVGYGITFFLHKPFPVGIFMYAAIMGWVGLVIIGYLHKIIPFLWWTFKYSAKMGQDQVPSLKDLVSERIGAIGITGLYVFTFLNVLFLSIGVKIGIQISQGLLFLTAILYAVNLFKMVIYKPNND